MLHEKDFPRDPSFELQRALLVHPEPNPTTYVPFEDADQHPFVPDPHEWSRANAWWLADASWLAYAHAESDVRRTFLERANVPSCELIDHSGTQCYLAHGDSFAIVAFRGTQPDDWKDLFEIVRFLPTPWDVGRVHTGFADALEAVWGPLERSLDAPPARSKVWFTGHSLRAALATPVAPRPCAPAAGPYTFAAP